MDNLETLEELFAGRHFDHFVRALVPSVQAQPARPGRDDGRAGPVAGTYDHHAMGPALHAGVREALAPVCPCSAPRHTSRSRASGAIYIVLLIGQVGQSTSGS